MTFVLDTTSRKIILDPTTGGGDLQFTASWADATATSLVEGASHGVGDAVNEVDVVAAPAASTRRIVKSITIHNANGSNLSREFILVYEDGASERIIARGTLAAGATWYSDDAAVNTVNDGDKGDITVSGSGATWTIDNNAITTAKILDANVTLAKIANITSGNLLGRTESGSGSVQEVTPSSGILAWLQDATSAKLATAVTDETGSGALVFGTSPTLATPTITTSATVPIVIGGTATTSTLRLRSTSGVGTTGADIIFQTGNNGGTEAMRILNNGLVGIGTTSPAGLLDISSNAFTRAYFRTTNAGANVALSVISQNGTEGQFTAANGLIQFAALSSPLDFMASGAHQVSFGTNSTERLRISSGGLVGIGTTSPGEELHVVGQGYFTAGAYIGSNASTNTLIDDASNGAGTTVLYIGNATITTSSDQRLKQNITNTTLNALATVQALRVVDFTWNDPSDKSWNGKNARGTWTGLIAQEAIEHVPWAVNAPRDPVTMEPLPNAKDQAGNDQLWFMEYQQVVPLLVKAIQELSNRVDQLTQ